MMITSLFFWPSPAVALVGAVLLPVALRVGLHTARNCNGGCYVCSRILDDET